VGQGEVGGFSMAMSVIGGRRPLVDLVRPISILGINGHRNQPSHLVFPVFKAHLSAMLGWHCRSDFVNG